MHTIMYCFTTACKFVIFWCDILAEILMFNANCIFLWLSSFQKTSLAYNLQIVYVIIMSSVHCVPKNFHLLFLVTLSKVNGFLIIFGMLNLEKTWHEHLTCSDAAILPLRWTLFGTQCSEFREVVEVVTNT